MKKRVIALYDILPVAILTLSCVIVDILLILIGPAFERLPSQHDWKLDLLFWCCIILSLVPMLFVQEMKFNFSTGVLRTHCILGRRLGVNLHLDEVESVELVKLSKAEKLDYVGARLLFSKFLQVTLKYGHKKYIYVSHYSNKQIRKITEFLLSYKNRQ